MIGHANATFIDAINSGNQSFEEELEAGNFESEASVIIDIAEARKYGVRPNDIP